MSNTAVVSPVAVASVAAAPVVVAGAAVYWLLRETPADRGARARLKATRLQERLDAARCDLGALPTVAPLLETAERLGYQLEPVHAPLTTSGVADTRQLPEPLLVACAPDGRLSLHAESDRGRSAAHRLLAEHATRTAFEHLSALGMQPTLTTLPSGEIEIAARELTARPDGAARITAQVQPDGVTHVDIDGLRGTRCEQLLQGIARAQGGVVSERRFKPAAFQRPGESIKKRLRV